MDEPHNQLASNAKLCTSCKAVWSNGSHTPGCQECGGFPLRRPCCICAGKCGSIWTREVAMTHSSQTAHWDGKCRLPHDQQRFFFLKNVMEMDTDELALAMDDLL